MVLIISSSGGTVNDVIDWIASRGIIVHRLNPNLEGVRLNEIKLTKNSTDIEIYFEDYNITTKLSSYTGIWIWHADLRFSNCENTVKGKGSDPTIDMVSRSLDRHHKVLVDYFNSFLTLNTNKTIGNFNLQNLNKLEVLLKAKNIGLDIPETYIISRKEILLNLQKRHSLITKPYHEVVYPFYNEVPFQNYTSSIKESLMHEIEEEMFPTLVQEKIEKLFEIRSFYLRGTFYSMAIFSQSSLQTQLDFRNYDFEKPNRTIPFNIPKKIEMKLAKLFKNLNLDSGSVDMIFTNNNKFKFLEINPVGQFGMVSFPCNYYLDEIIMQHLTDERYK